MNPKVFLEAAKLVDGEASNFACNAIRRARGDDACSPDSEEIEFFGAHFLDGKPDPFGDRFGIGHCPKNREHRVMALLLCYAMTLNP